MQTPSQISQPQAEAVLWPGVDGGFVGPTVSRFRKVTCEPFPWKALFHGAPEMPSSSIRTSPNSKHK